MMITTKRHGEFIADLAAQSSGLGKFQMMGVAGGALTDQTRMGCDENQMCLVSVSDRFAQRSDVVRGRFYRAGSILGGRAFPLFRCLDGVGRLGRYPRYGRGGGLGCWWVWKCFIDNGAL